MTRHLRLVTEAEATFGGHSTDAIALSVCLDCALWICNADDSGIDDVDDWSVRFVRHSYGYADIVVDIDEPSFSHHRCDTCHGLAGDRLRATATLW